VPFPSPLFSSLAIFPFPFIPLISHLIASIHIIRLLGRTFIALQQYHWIELAVGPTQPKAAFISQEMFR
jgi:hypothetical protein